MKKIVLIGASGFVGSVILNEALNRGIQVTAIVRNPEKIDIANANLNIVKGDAVTGDLLSECAKGADAVISAYNPGWANPHIYDELMKNYPRILEQVRKSGVKRLLIVGGAATLFVKPGVRLIDTGVIPDSFLPGVKGIGDVYLNILTNEKEIDWVFFSPAGSLEPGERTAKYRLGKDDLLVDEHGSSRISVQDYAKAMIDELEDKGHHRERFTIGY